MDGVVLVLNQNYEPLNVTNLPRAFRLVFGEKAEVVEYDHQVIRTPRSEYRAPSVIRLQHQVRRPRPRVKLSRREIFVRDGYTCQYCGKGFPREQLNLDHVIPRDHGGKTTWENIVCSCIRCNTRKANRLPHEAGMRLIRKPVRPKWRPVISLVLGNQHHEHWKDFLDVAYWNVELED